jgi:hypothetical protein
MGYFLLFTGFYRYKNSYIILSILIGLPVSLNILLANLVTILLENCNSISHRGCRTTSYMSIRPDP